MNCSQLIAILSVLVVVVCLCHSFALAKTEPTWPSKEYSVQVTAVNTGREPFNWTLAFKSHQKYNYSYFDFFGSDSVVLINATENLYVQWLVGTGNNSNNCTCSLHGSEPDPSYVCTADGVYLGPINWHGETLDGYAKSCNYPDIPWIINEVHYWKGNTPVMKSTTNIFLNFSNDDMVYYSNLVPKAPEGVFKLPSICPSMESCTLNRKRALSLESHMMPGLGMF